MDCFSFNDEVNVKMLKVANSKDEQSHSVINAESCTAEKKVLLIFNKEISALKKKNEISEIENLRLKLRIQRLENRLNEFLSKLEEIGERAENEPQMPNIVPSSLPEITSISANHDKKISISSSVSFVNDQCMESSVCLPSLSSEKIVDSSCCSTDIFQNKHLNNTIIKKTKAKKSFFMNQKTTFPFRDKVQPEIEDHEAPICANEYHKLQFQMEKNSENPKNNLEVENVIESNDNDTSTSINLQSTKNNTDESVTVINLTPLLSINHDKNRRIKSTAGSEILLPEIHNKSYTLSAKHCSDGIKLDLNVLQPVRLVLNVDNFNTSCENLLEGKFSFISSQNEFSEKSINEPDSSTNATLISKNSCSEGKEIVSKINEGNHVQMTDASLENTLTTVLDVNLSNSGTVYKNSETNLIQKVVVETVKIQSPNKTGNFSSSKVNPILFKPITSSVNKDSPSVIDNGISEEIFSSTSSICKSQEISPIKKLSQNSCETTEDLRFITENNQALSSQISNFSEFQEDIATENIDSFVKSSLKNKPKTFDKEICTIPSVEKTLQNRTICESSCCEFDKNTCDCYNESQKIKFSSTDIDQNDYEKIDLNKKFKSKSAVKKKSKQAVSKLNLSSKTRGHNTNFSNENIKSKEISYDDDNAKNVNILKNKPASLQECGTLQPLIPLPSERKYMEEIGLKECFVLVENIKVPVQHDKIKPMFNDFDRTVKNAGENKNMSVISKNNFSEVSMCNTEPEIDAKQNCSSKKNNENLNLEGIESDWEFQCDSSSSSELFIDKNINDQLDNHQCKDKVSISEVKLGIPLNSVSMMNNPVNIDSECSADCWGFQYDSDEGTKLVTNDGIDRNLNDKGPEVHNYSCALPLKTDLKEVQLKECNVLLKKLKIPPKLLERQSLTKKDLEDISLNDHIYDLTIENLSCFDSIYSKNFTCNKNKYTKKRRVYWANDNSSSVWAVEKVKRKKRNISRKYTRKPPLLKKSSSKDENLIVEEVKDDELSESTVENDGLSFVKSKMPCRKRKNCIISDQDSDIDKILNVEDIKNEELSESTVENDIKRNKRKIIVSSDEDNSQESDILTPSYIRCRSPFKKKRCHRKKKKCLGSSEEEIFNMEDIKNEELSESTVENATTNLSPVKQNRKNCPSTDQNFDMDEILIVEENSNKELNGSSNKNNTGNLLSETSNKFFENKKESLHFDQDSDNDSSFLIKKNRNLENTGINRIENLSYDKKNCHTDQNSENDHNYMIGEDNQELNENSVEKDLPIEDIIYNLGKERLSEVETASEKNLVKQICKVNETNLSSKLKEKWKSILWDSFRDSINESNCEKNKNSLFDSCNNEESKKEQIINCTEDNIAASPYKIIVLEKETNRLDSLTESDLILNIKKGSSEKTVENNLENIIQIGDKNCAENEKNQVSEKESLLLVKKNNDFENSILASGNIKSPVVITKKYNINFTNQTLDKEEGYNGYDGGTSNDLKLAEENNYEKSVENSLCSGSGETTTETETASETEFLKCNSESKIIDAQMFNVKTICKNFTITRNNDISFTSEIKDSISNDITETGGRENNIDSDSESELVIDESSGKALGEIDVEDINPINGEKVSEIFTSIIDDSIVKKKFAEVHQTNCSDNFENTVPNNFVQDAKINLTCSDEIIFKSDSDSDSDSDILPPLIIDEVNCTEQNCNTDNSCNSFMLDSCNQKEFPEKFPETNYDSTNSLTENCKITSKAFDTSLANIDKNLNMTKNYNKNPTLTKDKNPSFNDSSQSNIKKRITITSKIPEIQANMEIKSKKQQNQEIKIHKSKATDTEESSELKIDDHTTSINMLQTENNTSLSKPRTTKFHAKKRIKNYSRSLCRFLTEIYKRKDNKIGPLSLCYDLLKEKHRFAPFLIVCVAGVWKELFQISEDSTEEESIHLSSIAFGVQKSSESSVACALFCSSEIISRYFTIPSNISNVYKSIPFLKDRIVLMCSSDSFENPWLFTSSLVIFAAFESWDWTKENLIDNYIIPNLRWFSNYELNELAFGVFCNLYVDILLHCPERPSCEVLFNFFEKPASYKGNYVQDCSAMALMKCLILAKIEIPPALEAWYETNGEDSKVKVIKYLFQRKHMSKTSENLSFDDVTITFNS
ncbi:uncharacterized protein CDAR_462201 [Caerostris darwini]|uniref:Uncharacterized protein n=1 Tax=Caerostris darwini TaxID=1538125 RepID=A0AAV4RBM0_9ARAC|nr:uncharacterized protein CDAR_462201 [Caerostris darwini]